MAPYLNVTLQNGVVISNVEKILSTFCREDHSFRLYDSIAVKQDDRLEEGDVRLANKIVARMPDFAVMDLMRRSAEVNAALAKVPPTSTLSASSEDIPWDSLGNLFQSMIARNVGLPRATKILHKKRPDLIPILDSVVVNNCTRPVAQMKNPSVVHMPKPSQGVEYCRIIKTDLDANIVVLTQLKALLEDSGIRLGIVRILDILVWTRFS